MILILSSLIFSSCTQKPAVVIGFAGGLSSSSYDLGVSGMYGAMMAVEDINAKGGVLGKELKIVFKNDLNTPEGALIADKEFSNEGIGIIIGHMTSGVADVSVQYSNENGLLLISPTIAAVHMNQKDDSLIRLIPDNFTQADAIWSVFKFTQSKKIAIVLSETNYVFARQISDRIYESTQNQNVIVDTLLHKGNQEEDVHEQSLQLISQGYDGIVLLLPAEQVANFAQHFRKFNYQPTVALPAWSMTSELHRLGGVSVEGFYSVNYVDFGSDNIMESEFVEAYSQRYGNAPTFASIQSYDAVQLAIDAMIRCGSDDPREVKEEILSGREYSGLGGFFEIDAYGDAIRSIHVFVTRNGGFQLWQH